MISTEEVEVLVEGWIGKESVSSKGGDVAGTDAGAGEVSVWIGRRRQH